MRQFEGVKIGERSVNNLRLADAASLMADSEETPQKRMGLKKLETESKEKDLGLKINIKRPSAQRLSRSK